jgi:energy-coupling factor transporter ATP-binding protein EcfA2
MLFVQKIEGTVKGLRGEVALGPKTLIVGPNGAGKSRIVNAAELALSGWASDVVGRPVVKAGADLIALAPPDEPLAARATLSDGRTAAFRVERRPGGTAKPAHAPIAGLTVTYPAVEALAALRGTTAAARVFVLRHAGLATSIDAIAAAMPGTAADLFRAVAGALDGEPVDRLLAAREQAGRRLRAVRGEIKALEGLPGADYSPGSYETAAAEVEALLADLPRTGPVIDPAANAAAKAATEAEIARRRSDAAFSDYSRLEGIATDAANRANGVDEEIDALLEQMAQAGIDPDGADDEEAGTPPALDALRTVVSSMIEAGAEDGCWVCGTQGIEGRLPSMLADLDGAIAGYAEQAEQAVLAAEARAHLAGLRAQHARLVEEATGAIARAEQAEQAAEQAEQAAQRASIAATAAQAAVRPAPAAEGRPDAADRLRAAQARAATLAAAKGRAEAAAEARDKLAAARAEAADLEHLDRAIGDAIEDLVRGASAAFTARVQAYLPESDRFALRLQDGKSEVCDFGLIRDGGALHTALSGAEWARLLLALGAATTPTGPDVLAVLVPEERAFDPATLAAVMRALSDAPGQVILTSPVRPRGKTPRGWTVIEVGTEAGEAGGEGAS